MIILNQKHLHNSESRLSQDMKEAGAWDNFQRFAKSYRNMYVGWINDAKTDETRQKRNGKLLNKQAKTENYSFRNN